MKKIIYLMKKDIYFYWKMYLFVILLVNISLPLTVLGIDGSHATNNVNFAFPASFTSIIFIPYSYTKEDDLPTRKFLTSLPISKKEIIDSKILLNILSTGVIILTMIGTFSILGEEITIQVVLIPLAISIFMNGIFLLLFYIFDIHIARTFMIAPMVIVGLMAKKIEEIKTVPSFMEDNYIILFIALLLFMLIVRKFTIIANKF